MVIDADQMLDVEAAGDEVLGQRVEQFGIARRIRAASVVDRVDDAASQKVGPHPIGHRAGKERIVAAGHPVGETDARIVVQAERELGSRQAAAA